MAALCGKVSVDVELHCAAAKMWEGVVHAHVHYPKIFPEKFVSMEFVHGDCLTVGSLKKIVFTEEIPHIKMTIEKIEVIDHENMKLVYSLHEGDLLRYFKAFTVTTVVVPKGDGCIVTWSMEYEKVNEEPPSPHVFLEKAKHSLEHLAAHLHKH